MAQLIILTKKVRTNMKTNSNDVKVKLHGNICNSLSEIYKCKNSDYGDSFAKLREEYPIAICVRLQDKLNRLKTLIGNQDAKVKDESIEDTLLDLANYAIMEVTERRYEKMMDNCKIELIGIDKYHDNCAVDIHKIRDYSTITAKPCTCVNCHGSKKDETMLSFSEEEHGK